MNTQLVLAYSAFIVPLITLATLAAARHSLPQGLVVGILSLLCFIIALRLIVRALESEGHR